MVDKCCAFSSSSFMKVICHYYLVHARRHLLSRVPVSTRAQNPSTSEKSPLPTSLSSVQSHVPSRNFAVATARLVTVTVCFHNSALSCFIVNGTLDMLQQQEALYFEYQEVLNIRYANLGSHVQFQMIKSNPSFRQRRTCESTLLHQFLPDMD